MRECDSEHRSNGNQTHTANACAPTFAQVGRGEVTIIGRGEVTISIRQVNEFAAADVHNKRPEKGKHGDNASAAELFSPVVNLTPSEAILPRQHFSISITILPSRSPSHLLLFTPFFTKVPS